MFNTVSHFYNQLFMPGCELLTLSARVVSKIHKRKRKSLEFANLRVNSGDAWWTHKGKLNIFTKENHDLNTITPFPPMGGSPGDVSEELILQTFRHFTYVTAHSPTLPSLYLRHSSFSKASVAWPTSLLILQPFRCFTYVTAHSPTLLSLLLRHRLFTYVTWRAAHIPI